MKKYIEFLLNVMICVLVVECIGSIVYVFAEYNFVVSEVVKRGLLEGLVQHFIYNTGIAWFAWRYLLRCKTN